MLFRSGDPEFERKKIRVIGENTYNRNFRQVTGSSRSKLIGPGQQAQIDDCTSKVVLLDELTRMPLGTGRFFSAIDSWSKALVGLHDTLEGSTFSEAMECLYVSFTDKKEFFAERGITANPEMFPAKGVFKAIVADNGPLRGHIADHLPETISSLSNTRAYRPDDKGDIEASFNAYLRQCAEKIPGYNRNERCRGDADPKVIAFLTTSEYRTLLWNWAEVYQQRALRDWWPQAVLESQDKPVNSPIGLWTWGIRNVAGFLTSRSPDDLRRGLLATADATLTARRGLTLEGLVYVLKRDEVPPSIYYRFTRSTTVTVYYSRKYTPRIFISIEGKTYLGHLRSDLMEPFGQMTFHEVQQNYKTLLASKRAAKSSSNKARRKQHAKSCKIIAASKDANLARFGSAGLHQILANAASKKQTRNKALHEERRHSASAHASIFKSPAEIIEVPSNAPDSTPVPKSTGTSNKLSIDEMLAE